MNAKQVQKKLLNFLESQEVLTIASCTLEKPWIATVFYVSNERGELFFLSSRTARHSNDYSKNPAAAVAIYDCKSVFGTVYGIQAEGTITRCTAIPEIVEMGLAYANKFPDAREEFLNPQDLVSSDYGGAFYKFVPTRVLFRTPEIKEKTGKSTYEIVVK